MKKKTLIIVLIIAFVLALGFLAQTVPDTSQVRTVTMMNLDGDKLGVIQLSETNAGVLMVTDLSGLTPNGEHAVHIHEVGKCSGNFKSAGGHYNPADNSHGLKHPKGHHAGDMPNLKPDAKGNINARILNQAVTLKAESVSDKATVFDADGSAIIIHAGADDHMSQPSGAAGDRIACGVIK